MPHDILHIILMDFNSDKMLRTLNAKKYPLGAS